jgi:dihydroneopterin aldolase
MKIELNGLTFHAYHGVYPSEHIIGGTYVVDLVLDATIEQACVSDCLDDTIDYGSVCMAVREEMEQPSTLIEYVAARIARRILRSFPSVNGIEIRLCKQNPPIEGIEIASACVRGSFSRDK